MSPPGEPVANRQTELRPAYVWDCDQCGLENFERAVVHEFSRDEVAELAVEGEDATTGNWMTCPETVKCRGCGAEFEARHLQADNDQVIGE